MTEIEKDKTPSSPDPGAKRFFQNVDNLTFIDYYTVKEKVKESQSQNDDDIHQKGMNDKWVFQM